MDHIIYRGHIGYMSILDHLGHLSHLALFGPLQASGEFWGIWSIKHILYHFPPMAYINHNYDMWTFVCLGYKWILKVFSFCLRYIQLWQNGFLCQNIDIFVYDTYYTFIFSNLQYIKDNNYTWSVYLWHRKTSYRIFSNIQDVSLLC